MIINFLLATVKDCLVHRKNTLAPCSDRMTQVNRIGLQCKERPKNADARDMLKIME